MFEILLSTKKEIKENNVFNEEEFDQVCWEKIIKEKEKNLINYLEVNKSDSDVIELSKYLEINGELK